MCRCGNLPRNDVDRHTLYKPQMTTIWQFFLQLEVALSMRSVSLWLWWSLYMTRPITKINVAFSNLATWVSGASTTVREWVSRTCTRTVVTERVSRVRTAVSWSWVSCHLYCYSSRRGLKMQLDSKNIPMSTMSCCFRNYRLWGFSYRFQKVGIILQLCMRCK